MTEIVINVPEESADNIFRAEEEGSTSITIQNITI
jgi:hypothetical protein